MVRQQMLVNLKTTYKASYLFLIIVLYTSKKSSRIIHLFTTIHTQFNPIERLRNTFKQFIRKKSKTHILMDKLINPQCITEEQLNNCVQLILRFALIQLFFIHFLTYIVLFVSLNRLYLYQQLKFVPSAFKKKLIAEMLSFLYSSFFKINLQLNIIFLFCLKLWMQFKQKVKKYQLNKIYSFIFKMVCGFLKQFYNDILDILIPHTLIQKSVYNLRIKVQQNQF
ncbi:unnamed protein product (macronuclear) [Paramecium tetraurelia]|uniref:Transmembrane protein n=1 Tax=Paramecium tetraurelia TaxID=5888 RepID=A0CJX2_PARTE|nr:uncharacterized protein GSPATT00000801001 [Paramecium tetraurelia]CAK71089.1 unnamed protein product [Paramecium tetraurelia]|eukprot:XP_001438486.1 hypothetical protein (macronuclear) [Paramecium tetraurelia strain d4-2]